MCNINSLTYLLTYRPPVHCDIHKLAVLTSDCLLTLSFSYISVLLLRLLLLILKRVVLLLKVLRTEVFKGRMLFLGPNQQCQSTEGNNLPPINYGICLKIILKVIVETVAHE